MKVAKDLTILICVLVVGLFVGYVGGYVKGVDFITNTVNTSSEDISSTFPSTQAVDATQPS